MLLRNNKNAQIRPHVPNPTFNKTTILQKETADTVWSTEVDEQRFLNKNKKKRFKPYFGLYS